MNIIPNYLPSILSHAKLIIILKQLLDRILLFRDKMYIDFHVILLLQL